MTPKKIPKRKPGRPRKKNREYSGPLETSQIRAWVSYLAGLVDGMELALDLLDAAGIESIWMFGREITKGIDATDSWAAKLIATADQAVRRKEAGLEQVGTPLEGQSE